MPLLVYLFVSGMLLGPEAPVGTLLHIRLTTTVGSYASRKNSLVSAVLIAPVNIGGETVIPAGSTLSGTIATVKRVGFGIVHETATLALDFDRITLPDGQTLPIGSRVTEVDNSRERVSKDGDIHGVRTTGCISYRVSGYIRTLILWYVHAELAEWIVKSLLVQVPEPEIYYPAGVELTLRLTSPMHSPLNLVSQPLAPRLDGEQREGIGKLAAALPKRAYAAASGKPSDVINVLFTGSRDQLDAAFSAAGWAQAQPTTFRTGILGIRAVAENRGYRRAPMSALQVNGSDPDMYWEKGLNDMSKRHHIRIWRQSETWDGRQVWIGAATRDIDFAYLRPGSPVTHRVAADVDLERDKVANDIAFANCAGHVDWVNRPGVPRVVRNATGDYMSTDGRVAVIEMNTCTEPRITTEDLDGDPLPVHGGRLRRFARREILSARSDLLRTNIYWRTYEGVRWTVSAIREKRRALRQARILKDAPPTAVLHPVALASAQPAGSPGLP